MAILAGQAQTEFAAQICAALGIDVSHTSSIDIHLSAGHAVTVKVVGWVPSESAAGITAAITERTWKLDDEKAAPL